MAGNGVRCQMREYHILNLGAGVQSTTLYLMACRDQLSVLPMTQGADGVWRYRADLPTRRVAFDLAIFADTQDEPVAVYEHLAWLESLNGPPIMRVSAGRLGDDLVNGKNTTGGRFTAIPAFTSSDGGMTVGRTRRQCSKEYKTEPIERAIRREVLGLKPKQRVSRRKPVDLLLAGCLLVDIGHCADSCSCLGTRCAEI